MRYVFVGDASWSWCGCGRLDAGALAKVGSSRRDRVVSLKRILLGVVVLLFAATGEGQTRFRSGIFLHHSTGGCIWGPNGSQVSVPAEIAKFNKARGLVGLDSVKMTERWWPSGDNEWSTWHTIFDNKDTANDIRSFFSSYPVIMIKSCYPSSSMSGLGSDADTLNPTVKSTANYKWHWRALIAVMKERPQNFFIIWTNAPLVAGATNTLQATLANAFCRWAKDTLAAGLDPIVGTFPRNIFVFDFFHQLAGADGKLPDSLASSSTDSHPNAAATVRVAPQLVSQVFTAALAYESPTAVDDVAGPLPEVGTLYPNYPNPFNPSTTIRYSLLKASHVRLRVVDILGREITTLIEAHMPAGRHDVRFSAENIGSGVYYCILESGDERQVLRMTLLR